MNKKKIFILILLSLLVSAGVAGCVHISISQANPPVITNGFLDKTKYVSGDQMLITASAEDSKGIKEVKAEIENENGIDAVKLNLIGGDDKKGTYQAAWTVHDVTGKKVYKTKIIATNLKEQSSEFALYWIDPAPNPGHTASEIGGTTDAERTFNSDGLYTFPGQIKIEGGGPLAAGKVLTSDANGLASWQTGSGGVTTRDIVTGSRSFDTTYQNATGKTMFVTVTAHATGGACGSASLVNAKTDGANPPITVVASIMGTTLPAGIATIIVPMSFIVFPGDNYRIDCIPMVPPCALTGCSMVSWVEWY